MKIISFTGPKGSGKDSCADMLKHQGVSQGKVSFAGPMKVIVGIVYGITPPIFEDPYRKERVFDEGPIVFDREVFASMVGRMQDFNRDTSLEKCKMAYDIIKPKELWTPRELLQYVGSEIIRILQTQPSETSRQRYRHCLRN
jgi:hypothetical protein